MASSDRDKPAVAPRADDRAKAAATDADDRGQPGGAPAALRVPATTLEAIYRHARASFPAECCGYLRGPQDGDTADEVVPCRNAQTDGDHPTVPDRGAESGFVITGTELLAFARSLDTDRPARILYHSHTNGRAYFSEVDRDVAAGPGGPYYPVQHLVVGITAAGVTEVAQFGWSETAKELVELARWVVRDTVPHP